MVELICELTQAEQLPCKKCRQAHQQIKHAAQMCEKTEQKRVGAEQLAIDLRKQLHEHSAAPRQAQRIDPDDAASHVQYLQSQLRSQEQSVQEAQQMKARYRCGKCF